MSSGNKPYYKVRFERIRALKAIKPDEAHKELRESGIWLFYKAIEADDLATAHQLLDLGVFSDYDKRRKPEEWLCSAWYKFPYPGDEKKRDDFIAELQEMEPYMRFAAHWDAMLGLAIALQDKKSVWKYAQKGGRIRQWGTRGEKWTLRQLMDLTRWGDVRDAYRTRCFFDDRGLEYELQLAELVYDTMKHLVPMTGDDGNDAEAELFFRPIMEYDHQSLLECSYYGAAACPFIGPACTGPAWERVIGMKVDSDFAGMFKPGDLIGSALMDYASEFGFDPVQIRDGKSRRCFAAQLDRLYKKYPRPGKPIPNQA